MRFHFLLLCLTLIYQGYSQDLEKIAIADEYYHQSEIDKALMAYEELLKREENFSFISENYLAILKEQKAYKTAEKFLQKAIDRQPANMQYIANLIGVYHLAGQTEKKADFINRVKREYELNPYQQAILAKRCVYESCYVEAIDFYLLSRNRRSQSSLHALDLAPLYRRLGDKQSMIEEYIRYAMDNQNRLSFIKNLLQNELQEEGDLSILEEVLIQKASADPNEIKYPELIIWVQLQRKNFYEAFIQARAIDKRLRTPGDRSMRIARIAFENQAFEEAKEIFTYVYSTYPSGRNYASAKNMAIRSWEQMIKNTYPIDPVEVAQLAAQYHSLYEQLAPQHIAFKAFRSEALLRAFYLNEIDSAAEILGYLVKQRLVRRDLKAQIKLDLGDLYLLKAEPWEATLLYSQVEKENPNDPISYDAKLRNARLNYYIGNFTLAKGHLDILKRNTTRDISNDALSLGMLITDNTVLDTTDALMKTFAEAQLLLFQKKEAEAEQNLITILTDHAFHSIGDEVCWLLSKIALQQGQYEEAISYCDQILDNFRSDILADDAAFKKAEIHDTYLNQTEKAQALYAAFLKDHPGSLYAAKARDRFRYLRGDKVN